jgi:hypothetical protein
MIEGLQLTFTGEELRGLLAERVREHRQRAEWWTHEATRTPESETEEAPLLPEHICEHEAERYEWRADVLEFLSEHVETLEVYRLGEPDLAFAELLPRKPAAIEQEEYEERTRVGFELGRLAKAHFR